MDEGIAFEPQNKAQQWVFWTQHRGQSQPELCRLKGQFALTLWWVVAGCWGSGFRGQTPRRGLVLTDLEDTLRGLVWQNWEGPGRSLGLPTIKEIIATRTLKIHRLKDPAFTSTVSRMSCSHGLQSQRETDWLGPAKTVMSTRGGASGNCSLQFQRRECWPIGHHKSLCECQRWGTRPCYDLDLKICHYQKAMSRHRSLPTPSWQPVHIVSVEGSTTWGQLPWGSTWPDSDCSKFLQASAATDTPTHPNGSAMPLPPPSPTEQVSPIKLLLSPAFVWTRNRTRGHPISRGGVKTKVKDQGLCDQIRGSECAPLGTMDQILTISFRLWILRATLDFGS